MMAKAGNICFMLLNVLGLKNAFPCRIRLIVESSGSGGERRRNLYKSYNNSEDRRIIFKIAPDQLIKKHGLKNRVFIK
jgi:hypothetical protein